MNRPAIRKTVGALASDQKHPPTIPSSAATALAAVAASGPGRRSMMPTSTDAAAAVRASMAMSSVKGTTAPHVAPNSNDESPATINACTKQIAKPRQHITHDNRRRRHGSTRNAREDSRLLVFGDNRARNERVDEDPEHQHARRGAWKAVRARRFGRLEFRHRDRRRALRTGRDALYDCARGCEQRLLRIADETHTSVRNHDTGGHVGSVERRLEIANVCELANDDTWFAIDSVSRALADASADTTTAPIGMRETARSSAVPKITAITNGSRKMLTRFNGCGMNRRRNSPAIAHLANADHRTSALRNRVAPMIPTTAVNTTMTPSSKPIALPNGVPLATFENALIAAPFGV